MRRGVYFLANDVIIEQALAFLNSFRRYNPTIPLCLVPFALDADLVRDLADRYDFSVWADDAMLRHCDDISRQFHHGTAMGQYRKLAMWTGPFEQFVYIDADTVVLEPIDFVFDHLQTYDFVTSHSDIVGIRRWVWHDSIYQTGQLTDRQIAYAANTGFLASAAGLIDPRQVLLGLDAPLALAPHMELICAEQPLLNYLIVTSGRPYSSLSVIAESTQDADIPLEQWAGHDIGRVESGRLISSRVRRTLLVHWAGQWQPVRQGGGTVPYHDLWYHYRSMAGPRVDSSVSAQA
jgi:hypothetical protein